MWMIRFAKDSTEVLNWFRSEGITIKTCGLGGTYVTVDATVKAKFIAHFSGTGETIRKAKVSIVQSPENGTPS